jgi:hypothetical protein
VQKFFDDAPLPVAKPVFLSTSPASPANDNSPELIGFAETGTNVDIYDNSSCTGSPVASDSASTFASAGITVSVADNTTTTFYATATDSSPSTSACSASSITFVEQTAVNSATENAPAGGTVGTNTTTTPADPVGTSVTTPVAGQVTIAETSTTTPDPIGYSLLGQQVQITAPVASAAQPLVLQFYIDASVLPPGVDETTIQVFRNGTPIVDCDPGAGTTATPNPCIADRSAAGGGGIALTVRTSQASTWNFGLHAAYAFQGFFAPIAAPPSLNPASAGSNVALLFSLGGNQGLEVLASGYPRSHKISCDAFATDQGDDVQAAGSLSYDKKSQRYSYSWKTNKSWASKTTVSCRQFVLRLIDGSVHRAHFKFK